MVRLSVNVNKVATLRNSRGGAAPSLAQATGVILDAGATGITVHPRADRRHITADDVRLVARLLDGKRPAVEYNIEGDPRPEVFALAHEVRPDQVTLVPVVPGEVTSHVGWSAERAGTEFPSYVKQVHGCGARLSVFVDADPAPVRWAASVGADRVELYTEPYARACERGEAEGQASFARFVECAELAASLGLGVNAGHDLDLANLRRFRTLPHLAEVSIGHALVSDALFRGLGVVVREYLAVLGE